MVFFSWKFHRVSAAVVKVAADVQGITYRLHILKGISLHDARHFGKRISDDFQRVADLDIDLKGGTSRAAHSPHRHGTGQHRGHWGTKQRTESSVQPRQGNANEESQTMQLVNSMTSAGLCQLTISVLVAPDYAVQVVWTGKRAGAVDDGRLGGNNVRKTGTISLPEDSVILPFLRLIVSYGAFEWLAEL